MLIPIPGRHLVVRPDGKGFAIVSGERRYRALRLLEDRGELPDDFAVNVEVREALSKDDTLRISTVENLQRANLAPLEETVALTKLLHKGVTLDDLVAQTGLSSTTIRRRLALNNLCKPAAKALREGELTLAQAEALTLGAIEEQEDALDQIVNGEYSPDRIRHLFLEERPSVALAIFPIEKYTGTITTDLFGAEESSYFDDAESFFSLQQEAVEQLAAHHRECAAWVEVTDCHSIPDPSKPRDGHAVSGDRELPDFGARSVENEHVTVSCERSRAPGHSPFRSRLSAALGSPADITPIKRTIRR
jgi:ParB/RepB/Spo0J family partition protein